MNTVSKGHFLKTFLRLFVPLLSLFAATLVLLYWYTHNTSLSAIEAREKDTVNIYAEHFEADLDAVLSDLKYLSDQAHLKRFVEGDETMREELQNDYLSFIREKTLYDQIRFLDASGMERIRVNFNYGEPEIVPQSELQNKADRYYFADAFAQNKNEIFVSPLDLNRERGKIDFPLKPMIRFGVPVFDSAGKKQGVLLFNYFGARILSAFQHSGLEAPGTGMLLNRQGYWLKGAKAEDEWGFMYPGREQVSFRARHPDEWSRIDTESSGQFMGEHGLHTFVTIRQLAADLIASKASATPHAHEMAIADEQDYLWKVLSVVSPERIAQQSWVQRQVLLAAFCIMTVVLLTFSLVNTRGRLSREITERKLHEKNIVLKAEHRKLEDALNKIRSSNLELDKAYQELKSAETQLLQAEKMQSVGRLAAGVAHEINTPIQFVGDNTRFIQDAIKDVERLMVVSDRIVEAADQGDVPAELFAEAKAVSEEIDLDYLREEMPLAITQSLEGIDRVADIVRAMKEFSHPGVAEKTVVDLNSSIKSAVTVSRNEWKYDADLELDLDPGLQPVTCLAGEINQVVLNIIVNAVHAIKKSDKPGATQEGKIGISTRQEPDWVRVEISDNGSGIPEDIRKKIFEPFFTTKDVGEGTGQGLAIAYSTVVDKHGGTIEVESEVGKGSTFIVRLPTGN